eukprot:CAMPEP_0197482806 /NCGR_PEP_ID=MMETSP1309-20131121/56549_1 /TAXON_ID=464262 /ORGANISM="Genus nov. species nov., Strain RCC998" /LENGTH=88 /DNA_ID=CAMNT_0043025365 /DNA_START=560 /DNA_END=827 /DNA_ORIENTATION=+
MYASHGVLNRPNGAMKGEGRCLEPSQLRSCSLMGMAATARPNRFVDGAEHERTRWDPKDGELCLGKVKPGETLVEVCSDSDCNTDQGV